MLERVAPVARPEIAGVRLQSFKTHEDDRGAFTEVYRREWPTGLEPVQWNLVRSEARVLRGVHVHLRHSDYLTLASGRAVVGLRDLRPGSPTEGEAGLVEMTGDRMEGLTIPVGVAHGFLFLEPSTHVYAVSHYWDPADELGCHWADPALQLDWPIASPRLSPRDRSLGPLSDLLEQIPPFSALSTGS